MMKTIMACSGDVSVASERNRSNIPKLGQTLVKLSEGLVPSKAEITRRAESPSAEYILRNLQGIWKPVWLQVHDLEAEVTRTESIKVLV